MGVLAQVIAEHPFGKGLQTQYIDLMTRYAANVRLANNFYLFRQGGEAAYFYLILQGKVALEVTAPPRPSLVLETVGEGETLGWSWLVAPYRWRFAARALEVVDAVAVDGRRLRLKCEKDPQLGYELLRRTVHIVGQRLEAARFRMFDLFWECKSVRPHTVRDSAL